MPGLVLSGPLALPHRSHRQKTGASHRLFPFDRDLSSRALDLRFIREPPRPHVDDNAAATPNLRCLAFSFFLYFPRLASLKPLRQLP